VKILTAGPQESAPVWWTKNIFKT